jgi:hypothetical protein
VLQEEKKSVKLDVYALCAYTLLACLLLLKYPLSDSLPGNMDTWYYMGVFHTFINQVDSFFTGCATGVYAYPFHNTLVLGDATWGSCTVYYFLFKILQNDIWAYYILMSLIFGLNGFGFYFVCRSLRFTFISSICGGFLFAFGNFFFGNIDNQNSIAFFPALFATANFIHFINTGSRKNLILAAVFCGIQVYFSTYNFFFGAVILWVFVLHNLFKGNLKNHLSAFNILTFLIIVLALVSCFFVNYYPLSQYPVRATLDMLAPSFCDYGLSVNDFLRSAKGNVIYNFQSDIGNIWRHNNKSVFPGLIFIVLVIAGLYKSEKKWLYILGALVGLVIAIGPNISIGGNCYTAPMYLVYKYIPGAMIIRTPVRGFFIVLFFLALAAVDLLDKRQVKWQLVIGILVIFFLENIPFKSSVYASGRYLSYTPPLKYECNRPIMNVLEIPNSNVWSDSNINMPLNNYNREFIYYYHQTVHKHNLVNIGYLNYIPIVLPIADMVNINNFDTIVKKWKVGCIIMNKEFILGEADSLLVDSIAGYYGQALSFDNNGNAIIRIW